MSRAPIAHPGPSRYLAVILTVVSALDGATSPPATPRRLRSRHRGHPASNGATSTDQRYPAKIIASANGCSIPVTDPLLGLAIGAGLIAAGVGLGTWATAVETPCNRPYAECAANSHLGELWGGLLLYILTGVVGLAGLGLLIASLIALFSKPKSRAVPHRRTEQPR